MGNQENELRRKNLENARDPEMTEEWRDRFGRARVQIQHKHKDVMREHECKNMKEYRNKQTLVWLIINIIINKNQTEIKTLQRAPKIMVNGLSPKVWHTLQLNVQTSLGSTSAYMWRYHWCRGLCWNFGEIYAAVKMVTFPSNSLSISAGQCQASSCTIAVSYNSLAS